MKLDNKTLFYIYIGVLFILTYLFTSRLITSLKTQEFDYIRVVKLGKIGNDKSDKL
jgi:hypothetical protein